MNVKCTCGSENLKAEKMTLHLMGVPFVLDSDSGPQYDDSEAKYSEGWDFIEEPDAVCADCGKKYVIESESDAFILKEVV